MTTQADRDSRPFDLVVFGATGFTGRQAAHYVAAHVPPGTRWAVAGRNRAKLDEIQAATAAPHQVVCDAQSAVDVDALARQARVVITTVGPYSRYGTALFAACAANGTHYTDITGETPWVRRMIDVHGATAERSGAVMVPLCGFDSIPSDLGTWMMVDWIRREWGQGTRDVRAAFKMRGGFNGGTLDSALAMAEHGTQRELGDPFLLNPEGTRPEPPVRKRSRDLRKPMLDPRFGTWVTPFLMAEVNTRVVRRSAALWQARGQGQGYGDAFAYGESMAVRSRAQAWGVALGLGMGVGLMSTELGRRVVRRVAPAPGEGPSEAQMDGGFFSVTLHAEADDGRVVTGRIEGQGDPGNRSTVRMLCESAFCLLGDPGALPVGDQGGIFTPSTAFGGVLLERLRAAGMMWRVEP